MPAIELVLYMAAAVCALLAVIGIPRQVNLIAAALFLAILVRLITVAQQIHG